MLANFLNKSKPINFIVLLFFFLICFVITVFNDGFELQKFLKSIILLVLFLSAFFFFEFITSKNKLTFDNSIAFYTFTVLVVSVLPELQAYKSLALLVIYLLFLRKIYSLRSSKNVIQKLYDSSFWLGVLFIIEPISILFLIVVYAAVYLHQKITINTLCIPIIGVITPVFIYFTYFFWIDKTAEFTENLFIHFNFEFYESPKFVWLLACVFAITLWAIFFKSLDALTVGNTFRRSWVLLIVNFIVAIVVVLFFPIKNGVGFLFILFPVAVIIANGVEKIKKINLKNLVLYTLIISSVLVLVLL